MTAKRPAYQNLPVDEVELQHEPISTKRRSVKEGIIYDYWKKFWRRARSWSNTGVSKLELALRIAKFALHALVLGVICGLVACLIILITNRSFYVTYAACQLDGNFLVDNLVSGASSAANYDYSPWGVDNTFAINMNFGSFEFGQAKAIDTAWDLIVGRGGQALLALISYRILNQALARSMETKFVSRATFEMIAFDKASASAVMQMTKDFYKNEGRQAKAAIFWVIFSTTILLIFPTLCGAMTGYTPNFDAVVQSQYGETLPLKSFKPVFYIIHDGSRLGAGWHDDFPITDQKSEDSEPVLPQYKMFSAEGYNISIGDLRYWRTHWDSPCSDAAPAYFDDTGNVTLVWDSDRPTCDQLWRVSEYTYRYGFSGSKNVTSSFFDAKANKNITLPSPALNISSHFLFYSGVNLTVPFVNNDQAWAVLPYGNNWLNASGNSPSNPDDLPTTEFLVNESISHFFSRQDLKDYGTCQQQGPGSNGPVTYAWGFSVQLLISLLAMLLVWMTGMYVVYLDTHLNGNPVLLRRRMGLQRAALDLAGIYQKVTNTDDVSTHTNKQLRALIGERRISYIELVAQMPTSGTKMQGPKRMMQSLRKSKWWPVRKRYRIGVLLVFVILNIFTYGTIAGILLLIATTVFIWAATKP